MDEVENVWILHKSSSSRGLEEGESGMAGEVIPFLEN